MGNFNNCPMALYYELYVYCLVFIWKTLRSWQTNSFIFSSQVALPELNSTTKYADRNRFGFLNWLVSGLQFLFSSKNIFKAYLSDSDSDLDRQKGLSGSWGHSLKFAKSSEKKLNWKLLTILRRVRNISKQKKTSLGQQTRSHQKMTESKFTPASFYQKPIVFQFFGVNSLFQARFPNF